MTFSSSHAMSPQTPANLPNPQPLALPPNLKLLAEGNTAEIYAYAPNQILKLFRPNFPLEPILAEYENSQFVSRVLPNVPKVYDLITSGGRHGIIYEKIPGPSLTAAILKSLPRLKRYSRDLARLHFTLHSRQISPSPRTNRPPQTALASEIPLPSVKTKLAADIDATPALTAEEKSAIKSHLRSLPDGNSLLHFDFHLGNILLYSSKTLRPPLSANPQDPANSTLTTQPNFPTEPIIIDWMTACLGDPCADVARTCLLLRYGELAHTPLIFRKAAHPFEKSIAKSYLAEYQALIAQNPMNPQNPTNAQILTSAEKSAATSALAQWLLPIAAARLREWITPHEQKQLLRLIRAKLAKMP